MSSGPKYGHLTGDGHGVRMTLKAAEYYNEKGGHFVKDNGSGTVCLADATTDIILGWAQTGKLTGYGDNYFLSVATSDALVINDADDTYRVPAYNAVTTADIGKRYVLAHQGANAAAEGFIQQVNNTGTDTTRGQLLVVAVDTDDVTNQTVQVKIAPFAW